MVFPADGPQLCQKFLGAAALEFVVPEAGGGVPA